MARALKQRGAKLRRRTASRSAQPADDSTREAPPSAVAQADQRERPTDRASSPPLRRVLVEIVCADIADSKSVQADVLLAGHYVGVLPQFAELALDHIVSEYDKDGARKLVITEMTRRGMLRGELGEVVMFPAPRGRTIAIGGMGRPGTFHAAQARVLAGNVAQVIGLLPTLRTLGTVVMGSGAGNLPVGEAVTAFLEGVSDALEGDAQLALPRIRLVERNVDRALEIRDAAKDCIARFAREHKDNATVAWRMARTVINGKSGRTSADFGCAMLLALMGQPASGESSTEIDRLLVDVPEEVRTNVQERLRDAWTAKDKRGVRSVYEAAMELRLRDSKQPQVAEIPARVAFWRNGDDIHASAITNSTTVSERVIPGRAGLVEQATDRLQGPTYPEWEKHAPALLRLVVPSELKETLQSKVDSLIIEVDRSLARVQWEMLPMPNGRPVGVVRRAARQLRTFYSPRPLQAAVSAGLRVLIIGDPADGPHALEAAREEALAIRALIERKGIEAAVYIGAPSLGTGAGPIKGVPAAGYGVIVDELLRGEYHIVHYCGHAVYEPENPAGAGWVFKGGVLSASELEGIERPPRLVFANACLSSQLARAGEPESDRRAGIPLRGDTQLVATLADEFFKRGVYDYVGTAWEIESEPAKRFAIEFYDALLGSRGKAGVPIGEAVLRARKKLFANKETTAWGAYQHYGDPTRSIA